MPNNWQILIVEDDNDSQKMVSKILVHAGMQVLIAQNGNEALEMLKAPLARRRGVVKDSKRRKPRKT